MLDQALSNDYRIFGKVRVADILSPEKGMNRKDWQIAFNKISSKHFDFVLCSKDKLDIIAVIELDDKSHNTKKAKARDSLVDNACKTAGLELIRFPAKRAYQVQAVREKIEGTLNPIAHK